MFKSYIVFAITVLFMACEESEHKKQPEVPVKPDKPSVKTFVCDTSQSYVLWERLKEMSNKNEKFRIGKAKVNLKIKDFILRTQGKFKLHHGSWTLHPDSSASATLAFDLKNGFMLGINEDERLELMHPQYLDVENYPFAIISVKNFRETEKSIQGEYFLTIKDSTAKIQPIVDIVKTMNGIPTQLHFTFSINAKKWNLHNPEKANEIVNDKLSFDCTLISN